MHKRFYLISFKICFEKKILFLDVILDAHLRITDCGPKIGTQLYIVKIYSLALYLPWLTVKAYLCNSFHYLQIPAE